MLIKHFTQYSEYLANPKIQYKDIAIQEQFLAPFKWDYDPEQKVKLGAAM